MQTTLRLDDELYRRAKTAAAEGLSLTKLVEEALREQLDRAVPLPRLRHLCLPVSTATGGLAPGFSNLQEAVAAGGLAADLRQRRIV